MGTAAHQHGQVVICHDQPTVSMRPRNVAGPLAQHSVSGVQWLHLLATTTWWILLPLAAGLGRLLHREIK